MIGSSFQLKPAWVKIQQTIRNINHESLFDYGYPIEHSFTRGRMSFKKGLFAKGEYPKFADSLKPGLLHSDGQIKGLFFESTN